MREWALLLVALHAVEAWLRALELPSLLAWLPLRRHARLNERLLHAWAGRLLHLLAAL